MLRFLAQMAADAQFYHRLAQPEHRAAARLLVMSALRSRGLWLLTVHRIVNFSTTQRNYRSPAWWLTRLLELPAHFLGNVVWKSDLLGDCELQGPVYLPDGGYLMCGALSVGAGTLIHDHVTIGFGVAGGNAGRPRIGRDVWIGPNCIIAGELEIGDGATLLPGTYLTYSVPPRAVVRGNPGRIIRTEFDNSALRSTRAVIDDLPVAPG